MRTVPRTVVLGAVLILCESAMAGPVLERQGAVLTFGGRPVQLTGFSYYEPVADPRADIRGYLDVLAEHRINFTRIFLIDMWANSGDALAPFAKVDGKFDLRRHDAVFFGRLKEFVSQAQDKGIAVQIALFDRCGLTVGRPERWGRSPYNSANNVNGLLSATGRYPDFLQMDGTALGEINRALLVRVVEEIGDFGNVTYEIMNEPWPGFQDRAVEWHLWVANILRQAFQDHSGSRVISSNYEVAAVEACPGIDIISYHHVNDQQRLQEHLARGRTLGKPVLLSDDGDSWSMGDPDNMIQAARVVFDAGQHFEHLDLSLTDQEEAEGATGVHGESDFPEKSIRSLELLSTMSQPLR